MVGTAQERLCPPYGLRQCHAGLDCFVASAPRNDEGGRYVSTTAITCPSATTSSILTSSDVSFPAAGEATGISIFIASTNATSSPSPTLLPASTGSTQTRPATSVTILISGIPFSEGTVWRIALANGLLVVAADCLR